MGMALRKKWQALSSLHPDVAIIQEVSEQDVSKHAESCWIGNDPHKGLAVVGFNGFKVRVHPAWDPMIEFVVPIEVTGPVEFLLLAVWVMYNRAVRGLQERPNRWQMLQGLEIYAPLLLSRKSVVAGDFNNAVRWDGPRKADNHSLAAQKLSDLGLVSAYHANWATAQGKEEHPTLYWRRHRDAPYHIDYIWLPQVWLPGLTAVEIGDYSTWVQGGLSDHVPLTVEVDDAVIGRFGPGAVNPRIATST
jgi:exodeoxyribonuclease III